MKKIIALFIVVTAVSCGSSNEELEAKKKALAEKQAAMTALEKEIEALELEIASLDTNASSTTKESTKVALKKIELGTFKHYTQLTGTVTSKENILISAEAMGRVVDVAVTEGQKVSQGQVLIQLENEAALNQLNEVKASHELALITYEKRKKLWDQNIGSEIEFLQAKSTYERAKNQLGQVESQYNKTFVKSAINGTVDDVRINKGELVAAGTPVVRVVDLDKVEIEAELSEQYLSAVKKGDIVEVTIPSLGVTQNVPIAFVSQVINAENRSFKIKVNLNNKAGLIKPNVLANLKIRDYIAEKAISVPSNAIRKDLKGKYIYVAEKSGKGKVAAKKYVETGKSSSDNTEIISGIKAGDEIIVSGYNQIVAGDPIRVN